jgi:hypothetical protein
VVSDVFAPAETFGGAKARGPHIRPAAGHALEVVRSYPGIARSALCRTMIAQGRRDSFSYHPRRVERLARRLEDLGVIYTMKIKGRCCLYAWAAVGSDAATAIEVGLDMLVRGLLAIAAWGRR